MVGINTIKKIQNVAYTITGIGMVLWLLWPHQTLFSQILDWTWSLAFALGFSMDIVLYIRKRKGIEPTDSKETGLPFYAVSGVAAFGLAGIAIFTDSLEMMRKIPMIIAAAALLVCCLWAFINRKKFTESGTEN